MKTEELLTLAESELGTAQNSSWSQQEGGIATHFTQVAQTRALLAIAQELKRLNDSMPNLKDEFKIGGSFRIADAIRNGLSDIGKDVSDAVKNIEVNIEAEAKF